MPQKGNCSFCNSQDVDIIDPKLLLDYFELLINIYEINPEGKNLVEWLKEDWCLFSHSTMDNAHAKDLLGEILDDGDIVRKNFSPSENYKSMALRNGIHYEMRSFTKTDTSSMKKLILKDSKNYLTI